jgi:hypothetical protein
MGVNGQQHVPVTSSPRNIRLDRPRNPEKMYVLARNGTFSSILWSRQYILTTEGIFGTKKDKVKRSIEMVRNVLRCRFGQVVG